MIVDSMWAEPLDSSQVLERFRVIGAEHLRVGERGSMVVLPHFGNWDMAASASLGLGLHLEHGDGASGVARDHRDGDALAAAQGARDLHRPAVGPRSLPRAPAGEDGRPHARCSRGRPDGGGAVLRWTRALQRRAGAPRDEAPAR